MTQQPTTPIRKPAPLHKQNMHTYRLEKEQRANKDNGVNLKEQQQ